MNLRGGRTRDNLVRHRAPQPRLQLRIRPGEQILQLRLLARPPQPVEEGGDALLRKDLAPPDVGGRGRGSCPVAHQGARRRSGSQQRPDRRAGNAKQPRQHERVGSGGRVLELVERNAASLRFPRHVVEEPAELRPRLSPVRDNEVDRHRPPVACHRATACDLLAACVQRDKSQDRRPGRPTVNRSQENRGFIRTVGMSDRVSDFRITSTAQT